MKSGALDVNDFRETQHRSWDATADGWNAWSEVTDGAARDITERLVELAHVQPGSRVLDVACGHGEPALTAARRAGAEGSVVATDISANMLDFARGRAAAAGFTNVEFVKSDAAGLDLDVGSFDAAVSRWGIIFEPDADQAAARVRTFLKPGSRFAISSWGPPEEVPFLSIPMRTIFQRFDVAPPAPGTPGPLSRPTPDAITALLEGGGFSNITVEQGEVAYKFDSAEHFTAYVRAIAAPIRALIERHAGDAQEDAWNSITQAAADAYGNGPVTMRNVILLAAGEATG
jgi:SAM-dependent methyltransferase